MKNEDLQSRVLYSEKLSFRIEGQLKSFPDKKKLKEFITLNQYYKKVKRPSLRRKTIKNMNKKIPQRKRIFTEKGKPITKTVNQ